MDNYYDKVAKRFGGYAFGNNKPKYIAEYPSGDPEEIFKGKLLKLAKTNFIGLDIGCGDGKFAFSIAKSFAKIIGLDSSRELLKIAAQKQRDFKGENVSFVFGDAQKTPFGNNSFDIIFNRRGPSYYKEYYRLLNNGGYYLEIGIGDKDCVDLKKIFGRGQGYGTWDQSRLEKDKNEFNQLGFKIIYTEAINYNEYYESTEEFDNFLQGVPIFEDFDSDKDKIKLEAYCEKFKTPKGILLPRQRVVYVVQKLSKHQHV